MYTHGTNSFFFNGNISELHNNTKQHNEGTPKTCKYFNYDKELINNVEPKIIKKIILNGTFGIQSDSNKQKISDNIEHDLKRWINDTNDYRQKAARQTASRRIMKIYQKNIKNLDLSNLSLDSIPPFKIINNLMHLTKLDLRGNKISFIPANIFDKLINLRELYLLNNKITGIAANAFNGLPHLIKLDLNGNLLSDLSPNVFDGLSALIELDLSDNRINTIVPGVFNNLKELIMLYLHGNQLNIIVQNVFNGLTKLQRLDLSDNQISIIDNELDGLTNLQELDLGSNPLVTITLNKLNPLCHIVWPKQSEFSFGGFNNKINKHPKKDISYSIT